MSPDDFAALLFDYLHKLKKTFLHKSRTTSRTEETKGATTARGGIPTHPTPRIPCPSVRLSVRLLPKNIANKPTANKHI